MTAPTTDPPESSTKPASQWSVLVVTFVLSAVFILIFVSLEDPYSLGSAFLSLFVYIIATALTLTLAKKPRTILILLAVSLAIAGAAWAVKGDGYPVSSATTSYTSSCTTFTNGTSGLVQQMCGAVSHTGSDIPQAVLWNILAWVPLVGALAFAVPRAKGGRLFTYGSLGRMLTGSIPGAALLFTLLGARSAGLIGSPTVGFGPLNPYVAFRECDSTTSLNGCSFNNNLYLLVDFLFWLAVAMLVALLAGAAYVGYERTRGRRISIGLAGKWTALSLAVLLALGLTVVPSALTQGGAIATSGSTFSFTPGDFVDIPFNPAHAANLTGSFASSIPVYVYLLNSTQFGSFDLGGDSYCPVEGATPLASNATQGSLAAHTFPGPNTLLFCAGFDFHSAASITIQVTSPIRART